MDLVIRGAQVVSSDRIAPLDVAVNDGKIAALLAPGEPCTADECIDAHGLYLLPGLVDAHVHMRDPGMTNKESIVSGTIAAACGGVTTVLDMPNTMPPVADVPTLRAKTRLVPGRAHVDVGFYALLGPGTIDRLPDLAAAGCMGFKLFLGPTTGNLQAPDWGELTSAFRILADLRIPIVVHAEDRAMIDYWLPRARQMGDDYAAFLAGRPESGEIAATERICRLAGETGAAVHIAHVTLAQAVDVIAAAKERKWPVTAETCPPYLFLTADDYRQVGTAMKVLPPVRQAADRAALWAALRCGTLDMVATDHAPHTTDDKAKGLWDAAAGAPGVETLLPMLLAAARRGTCTLPQIVRWCAEAPAIRFGIAGKGRLTPGAWADMVLVDLQRPWEIKPQRLHSLSASAETTPFHGWTGNGAPVMTLLHGRVVAQDGEPVGQPAGQWVHPGSKCDDASC